MALPRRTVAYAGCGAALAFMVYQLTTQTSLLPLFRQVCADLSVNDMQGAVISASFLVVYACMQIPAGVLIDRFGSDIIVPVCCLAVGGGALLFAGAQSLTGALVARMLMGIAAAFAFPSIGMAARRALPASMFPLMMGIADVGLGLGGVIGNLGAARLEPLLGWRGTMQACAVVAVPLAFIAWWLLPRTWFGPAPSIRHSSQPGGGLRSVLASREVRLAAIIYGGGCGTMFGFGSLWGNHYAMAWDESAANASAISTAFFVGLGLGAPLTGWLGGKLGPERPLKWGLWLSLIMLVVRLKPRLLIAPDLPRIITPPVWFDCVNVALIGIGVAATVLAFEIGCRGLPARLTGTTVGVINLAGVGCGALLQVLPGIVPQLMNHTPFVEVQYANLFFVAALVVALVAFLRLPRSVVSRS